MTRVDAVLAEVAVLVLWVVPSVLLMVKVPNDDARWRSLRGQAMDENPRISQYFARGASCIIAGFFGALVAITGFGSLDVIALTLLALALSLQVVGGFYLQLSGRSSRSTLSTLEWHEPPVPSIPVGQLSEDGTQFWNGTTWTSTVSTDGQRRWTGTHWAETPDALDGSKPEPSNPASEN
jgi:hypothetical protein